MYEFVGSKIVTNQTFRLKKSIMLRNSSFKSVQVIWLQDCFVFAFTISKLQIQRYKHTNTNSQFNPWPWISRITKIALSDCILQFGVSDLLWKATGTKKKATNVNIEKCVASVCGVPIKVLNILHQDHVCDLCVTYLKFHYFLSSSPSSSYLSSSSSSSDYDHQVGSASGKVCPFPPNSQITAAHIFTIVRYIPDIFQISSHIFTIITYSPDIFQITLYTGCFFKWYPPKSSK